MEMPAFAQNIPLKRIRDLLALSHSPNPHEAARARERADELLRKHGLTEADLKEEATETTSQAPGKEGHQRDELARVVAQSRGVTFEGGGEIKFRGYPEAARDARELFLALTRIVENNCEITGQQSDVFLWRTCFWLGYVEAIQRQTDPEHAQIPTAALAKLINTVQKPPAIEKAAQAFNELRQRMTFAFGEQAQQVAEGFKQAAHDAGFNLGCSIPVPAYKGKR